jgi:hypothetical protein
MYSSRAINGDWYEMNRKLYVYVVKDITMFSECNPYGRFVHRDCTNYQPSKKGFPVLSYLHAEVRLLKYDDLLLILHIF